MNWSANQYLKFEDDRNRAIHELVSRIPLDTPETIVDVGCGPGNSTEILLKRYRKSKIYGFDTSDDMLAKARKRLPNIEFEYADASTWLPKEPVDIIFSNAVFHWIDDHVQVLAKLFNKGLKPGGVLAIQMPDNIREPTHYLMPETAKESPWASKLAGKERDVLPPVSTYYNALAESGQAASIDIWHAHYNHVMNSPEDIVEWIKGSALIPFMNALNEEEQKEFTKMYTKKIEQAYPRSVDGKVLLKFPRLFIVAQRK